MNRILLGVGLLSWPQYERIAGRYGLIKLFREGDEGLEPAVWYADLSRLKGQRGSFLAIADDGREVPLGSGTVFTEEDGGITYIGLKPDDNREENWLIVEKLYEVDGLKDGKMIELYFVPNVIILPQCTKEYAYCNEGMALQVVFYNKLAVKGDKEFEWGPENSAREQDECDAARKAWYAHVKQCHIKEKNDE